MSLAFRVRVSDSGLGTWLHWIAAKELILIYYIGDTISITIYIYVYTHYGNSI